MRTDAFLKITQYDKDQWARMAQRAYSENRNAIGHRFSAAASITGNARMSLATYDALMNAWRAWFVFNDWTKAQQLVSQGN